MRIPLEFVKLYVNNLYKKMNIFKKVNLFHVIDVLCYYSINQISFFMTNENEHDFNEKLILFGKRIKELRISAGYNSYEVFAWENNLSRIQYWKMEQGTNCTLKSLNKILKVHQLSFSDFFSLVEDKNEL